MTAVIAPQVAHEILALVDASDRSERALNRIATDHGLLLTELRALIARRPTTVQRVTPPPDETKVCTSCRRAKPLADFYPQKGTRDGRASWCRDCVNTKRRPTPSRMIRSRAHRRASQLLIDRHRDEFEQLLEQETEKARAEHERITAAAAAQGRPDAATARLKVGPKRREETDVVQRLDVARCPTCHTHHDADHVCPNCGEQTAGTTALSPKHDVDEIAVQRAVDGDRTVKLTVAERREAIRTLHGTGLSDGAIADRLGISAKTSLRVRQELGLPPNERTDTHVISSEHGTARGRARRGQEAS